MGRTRQVAVLVMGTALLGGCSGGMSGSGDRAANDAAGGAVAAAPSSAASSGLPGARSSQPSARQPLVTGGAKIRTAQLTVTVTDAAKVRARADAAVDLAGRVGGEVETDDRSDGRYAVATLRLRVPPAELDSALRELSTYGKASSRQVGSRDVTGQVADVNSRVASATRAIARLRALYDGAARVSDVIAIENELSGREADLESLQAQQRALAGQTTLATITLTLRAVPVTAKHEHDDRTGFLGGLADGWDAFTGFVGGLVTGLGAALPFLVLLALLALAGRVAWRRRRPSPRPATE